MHVERSVAVEDDRRSIPPVDWFDLASKHDLLELEGRIEGRLARLESSMTRSFVTWLLASQATVVTVVVGLLVALR